MSGSALTIGEVQVARLSDGSGTEYASQILSRSTRKDAWKDFVPRYFTDRGEWVFPVSAYLLRYGRVIVLIDAGFGPSNGSGYISGHLIVALKAHGVDPAAVTDVIFTHLHNDHIGWVSSAGSTTFRNARHHVHRDDWNFFFTDAPERAPYREKLAPARGQFVEFSAETSIFPWLMAHPAPGHTPGSTIYRISSGGEELLILGDVVHTPAQLEAPDWRVAWDMDPTVAAATRNLWTQIALREEALVTAAHFPSFEPYGRVVREHGSNRYIPREWGDPRI